MQETTILTRSRIVKLIILSFLVEAGTFVFADRDIDWLFVLIPPLVITPVSVALDAVTLRTGWPRKAWVLLQRGVVTALVCGVSAFVATVGYLGILIQIFLPEEF